MTRTVFSLAEFNRLAIVQPQVSDKSATHHGPPCAIKSKALQRQMLMHYGVPVSSVE
jgi:hypothetical protein